MTGTRKYLPLKRLHHLTAPVIDTSDLLLKPGYSPAHFNYLDLPRRLDAEVKNSVSILQHTAQTNDSLPEVSVSP